MKTPKYTDPLLKAIEAHLTEKGVTATQFGISAARDSKLVFNMRDGREPRHALRVTIEQYLKDAA